MAKNFYVVVNGKEGPAVYDDWDECELVVKGHPNAKYKGFVLVSEAITYLQKTFKTLPSMNDEKIKLFTGKLLEIDRKKGIKHKQSQKKKKKKH